MSDEEFELLAAGSPLGSVWQHKNSGRHYRVVMLSLYKEYGQHWIDDLMVTYTEESKKVGLRFSRTQSYFMDRFTRIS